MGRNIRGNGCKFCGKFRLKSAGVYLPYFRVPQGDYPLTDTFWCGYGGYKDAYTIDSSQRLRATITDFMTGKITSPEPDWDGSYIDLMGNTAAPGSPVFRSGFIQSPEVLAAAIAALAKYDLDAMEWNTHVRLTYDITDDNSPFQFNYKGPRTVTPKETWALPGTAFGDIFAHPYANSFFAQCIVGGTFGLTKVKIEATGFTGACIQHARAQYAGCLGIDTWAKSKPCSQLIGTSNVPQPQIITLDASNLMPNFQEIVAYFDNCAACSKGMPSPCY